MSSTENTKISVPWHHWPLALLAIVFYAAGAVDFTLSYLNVRFYTSGFSEAQLTLFTTMAPWLVLLWALGTWGGLAGAWLFWKRVRLSVLLLFVAFAALVALTIWLTFVNTPSLIGTIGFLGVWFMAGTCAIAFLFYTYARRERTEKRLI